MALLHLRSTLMGSNLQSQAAQLFNRPLMLFDNDENDSAALIKRQPSVDIDKDTHKHIPFYPQDLL